MSIYPKTDDEARAAQELKIFYLELSGQHDRINFDTVAMMQEYYEKLQTARAELHL